MTSTSTSSAKRFPGAITRLLLILIVLLILLLGAYGIYVTAGIGAVSQTSGTITVPGLMAPVRVIRDDRDIPHIVAANDHDLFFAQGYAEGSDRLFQMDLIRRFIYGRLAEVIGPGALSADEQARVVPMNAIVAEQWNSMRDADRAVLQAYSDGVNAAMQRQPLPVEFHLLLYRPAPWHPQDSLAVGMSTVLDLIDRWDDVIRRDAVARAPGLPRVDDLYSITDPVYDAPIAPPVVAPVPPLHALSAGRRAAIVLPRADEPPAIGSNELAVGAARSRTGRALLANDPHLRLGIPGVWYVVSLQSPGFHAAGTSLPGTPGIILGHNDNLAWGATNGTVVTEVVYRDPRAAAKSRVETFHVRLNRDVRTTYYYSAHGFAAQVNGGTTYAVDWNAVRMPDSPLPAFMQLNRAASIAQAEQALQLFPGPPQNFVLADRSGSVAYHLAGLVPNDPSWGMRVHAGTDPFYPFVPYAALPAVASSRDRVLFTANNRMYGLGYPLRLSANFAPPYRAKKIQELLDDRNISLATIEKLQMDTLSIPERDLARATLAATVRKHVANQTDLQPYLRELRQWDGRFDPGSRGAPIAWELRRIAVASLDRYVAGRYAGIYTKSAGNADLVLLLRVLRERPRGWWPADDYDDLLVRSLRAAISRYGTSMLTTWGPYAQATVKHPLSAMGASFLNGAVFPGNGDSFGLHVQTADHSQSFRAVWDVGNWEAGGLVIPSGESGEPHSGHYTDQSADWMRGRLHPLPFSTSAVEAAARSTLTLQPR